MGCSSYPPGTFLYISHNDNASANGRNNADLGPQPVKRLKQKVFAEVTKQSNGYHWRITFNNARESRQNPIYYFTVPTGQSIQNMKLFENGAVVKQGGVREVFNGASDKYLTSVGAPDTGVNGTPYYENVANTQNAIVGNRGGIYGLDDFVKNNTEVYFNRNGMTEEDKIVTDKLYDKIKNSTQNVFAFRPRDFDRGNTYVVEFTTVGDTEEPLYYIAGMKSYEKIPTGRFMHKSYQQWYGVQERYNITVDTSRLKTTFLKGTGIGTLDTKAGLASSAVTIEDTYTNTRFNPGAGDIGEYNTYKSTGNYSKDYYKQFHNRFVRDFRGGEDGINVTADRSKGNHTLYIEADVRNQRINFRLPYKVVTQSDIYQPVAKAATGVKDYTGNLGSASDYITEYRYNSVPGFKEPDSYDLGTPSEGLSFYKDRIFDFPKTSARIKEQSVKSVEWAGGTNDLTTGTRVIELTVENGRKELFKVPYDIDVVPGGKISAENVAKLNAAIREAYQKVDTNGNVSGTVPTVTSTTPVWVQKQIKVTYYDNENNARTNNQDDSVDYVDVLFKQIRKEATPTAPAISVPEDGSASVTPKGTTDKLVVSYRPTDQNADTIITVKKSGTTWGAVDTLPNGVTVNPSNGVVSITEPTVKDLSTITAKATYLNSDEASATDTVKTPDNVAPTVSFNGKALTENADNTRFIIYRGANFNPTFRVQDNKNSVTLSITDLPKGVSNVSTRGNKEFNYTITGDPVAVDAPLEERIATVVATDARNNTATYKFKYRIVDITSTSQPKGNPPVLPPINRAVKSTLGDPHSHFKVADNTNSDNDKYYPDNMRFVWKELNPRTFQTTDVADTTELNELGTITKYIATAVFPNTVNKKRIDGVDYTIYTPTQKAVQMTFNVTDTVAPTVKMTNPTNNTESVLGSNENNLPVVEIFRGATLNIPLKMFDNNTTGKINIKQISGLPAGVTLKDGNTVINNGNTLSKTSGSEANPATATITGTVAPNATLGTNVVTLKVSDDATGSVDKGNQATLKFKVKTYDLAFEDRGTPVNDNTRSDVLGLNAQSLDPNYYLTTTDGTNRGDGNFGSDMKFRYLKGNTEISERVSFDKIGKHSVKARAYFPNSKTSTKGLPTNPTTGLTGDTASVAGRGYLEKTVEFNVKPNTPTISQPQFYGTASSKPTVTVENLPTNAQLQNGATVTVELYQGTTKVASKTVTDRNGTTTLSAENFTDTLTEGQQVHAVVKVSGGQGTTAYSVNSDNSENRNVTGRSTLSNLATDKLVVQVQDLANNRRGTLSEAEKNTIKQAIFEANKNGLLRGKQVSDINISDTGLITALDKDNKIAELQINPNTGVVTRFAHIRNDYNITFTNNGKPANRSTDPGFEWSGDGKSLIYKFDATSGVALQTNEVLKTITATPKNAQNQPSLTTVTGNDKALGEANSNGFSRNASTGYFSKNGVGVNVLDLVNPTSYAGGGNIDNTTNKLVENNRTDINNSNIVGTTLGNDNISAANSANAIPLTNVVKKANGTSLVVRKQLYLMPKYTNDQLLQDRGNTNANNTNVINVYFVPVDPTAPQVERSTSNTLATTSAQASRLADNTSFASLAKVTDNYDKDDVTNPSSNTVRNKLNMWVKKGNTKVQIVENGVEKTDVINNLKKEIDPATYEVIAKTSDASGNKSHADSAEGASLGYFKVGYNLVARDIINVKRGETISADELKRFIQVQEGNKKVDLPQGATVTAVLETNTITRGSEETKTVEATVNFGENRTKKVRLTYKVLNTFPIANTIYDFKDVARGSNQWDYYSNTGNNIPGGMSWIFKPNGGIEKDASGFKAALASDPVGTTTYTFGGRYNYGRFTNPTTTTGNLEHTATLVHKVFDIADSKNVSVSQGTTLSAEQAKAAVKNATGSDTLPNGTTYEWVGNKVASTSGKQTFQVKVTLPVSQTGDNLPAATQVQPSKTIAVTVNVTPPKPTFDSNKVTSTSRTITGTLGGLNANSSNTVVSVALNDGTNRVLTSENNGGVRISGNTWTATLPDDVKLRTSVAKNGETTQPTGLTVTTKIKGSTTADDISVTSDVKAVEMGDYSVNATIAGSKHIDVKVPHDAKRIELRFHNSTETSNTPKSIVLVRSQNGGNWQVDSTATPAGVTNANNFVQAITTTVNATNKAENLVTITLKESHNNAKLRIKEENASGDNTATYRTGLGLRVDYKPEPRQAVTSAGNWKVVNVTNNKPTLTYKGTEASSVDARKVFPSGTSITKAMLENLVTVGDTEDKVTNEADKPYGTPTVKIVSGLTETPGRATASGSYAVVLKAVDSQGKESDPLTVYVGVVSTDVKYQPKVGDETKGSPIDIEVPSGTHHQGDPITYTPREITVGDKVYVPSEEGSKTVTLKDVPQTVEVEYVEKPTTATPTFTVGEQNPKTGSVEVTVGGGVPDGAKVTLPGVSGEKTVENGKVVLTNNDLPTTATTGKGIAQESGKLPKEGTSEITIPGKLTSAKGEPAREFEVTIPLPIVVPDPEHLTPKEIEKLVDKVKESNPNTIVTADDKGNVTVTDKTTGESVLIPVKDLTVKDFEPVKPTEKVPVKDKSHLTPEEKKQVVDKVKDKNPGKEVTVGDDGTATVTDPTTGISHTIPGTDLVTQDFEPVKPTEKVPVKDKTHLTPEEKKQVADKVKDKNPGKEVTVGDDGTATVTDPTTGISHTIPGTDLVTQDFEPVKPTEKVPVKDKSHLTPEEKKQVADKVKDKNPGKEVTVGDDGTATVTDPTTGISHTIPGTDLVNQDFEPVIPADKIPVKDPDNLTQEEQDKVKESVEKANPGKKVTVDKTGKVTITDPNTNISHEIPGEKLITLDPPVFELPEYTAPIGTTGVDENGNLIEPPVKHQAKLIITKWVDERGHDLKPADAKAPNVLGEANEAFEHGEIEGYVFVRTETKDDVVIHVFRKVSPATPSDDTNRRPDTVISAEEPATQPQAVLPNTGTQEDRATGALGVLSLLGAFGLLFAKKKKDDEEEA